MPCWISKATSSSRLRKKDQQINAICGPSKAKHAGDSTNKEKIKHPKPIHQLACLGNRVKQKKVRHNGARPDPACICGNWQSIGLELREKCFTLLKSLRQQGSTQSGRTCSTVWSAEQVSPDVDAVSCQIRNDMPICMRCGDLAWPNILMFEDRNWLDARSDWQQHAQQRWLTQLRMESKDLHQWML